jgi:GNAT superfamily N-acetyltransferase
VIPILRAATDEQLAAAVEDNVCALFRATMALPESDLFESARLSRHRTPFAHPFFNGVWRARLAENEVDAAIDESIDWFAQRGAPPFFWWVTPKTEPKNLPDLLLARGFKPHTLNSPGMVVDLDALDDEVRVPDGFTIVQAADEQQLDDWLRAVQATYGFPRSAMQAWVDITVALGGTRILDAPWRVYVGYLDGKPVATNLLFNGGAPSGGGAGLYAVGTTPEARGKGIGTAITLQPLLYARAQGYRYGVLFASPEGYPMYRRMGFRDMHYPISRYVWRNP